MKAKAEKLALALGMMVIATSCTTTSNSSNPTQSSQTATEVSNSVTVEKIKIDGSSTVYPITEAIAKEFQADSKNNVQWV